MKPPTVREVESLKAEVERDRHELSRLEGVVQQLKGTQKTLQQLKEELETLVTQRDKLEQQFREALKKYTEEYDHE